MALQLSDRMASVSYEIRDIIARAKKVEAGGRKIHYFNIGDPNSFGFAPPQHVTDAVMAALSDKKYSAYCPSKGDPQLCDAIGKIEGLGGEDVTIHSGLSEGIEFLMSALVNPGEHVLLPSPSYPLYITKLRILGGGENYYPCDSEFVPDIDAMRARINGKTRAIAVINPNNPTGASYPRKILKGVADLAAEFKLPIIADEIYDRLTLDEGHAVNMRDVASPDQLLVSGNGISKNFIYPGARVGYLAFHGEGIGKLRDAIVKLCNQRLSINWEMQRGALAAFTLPESHLGEFRAALRLRRDIVHKRLNEIPGISCVKPKAAFYSFPKVEAASFKDDREFTYSLLEETGVLVVPGSNFSPILGEKHFRLVFLAQPSELEEAMSKLDGFMRKKPKS
ncbi:MAG: aminotransferase class I/II-fold pyridoxal phosphate-dependent enzyme [Candidatus Micrarchaeota archaeon]|nr:aminotransferase class I/II-fold pyridoxal phosphate-dependent enzyme [Candidatus Micrarchaeota archaeon]